MRAWLWTILLVALAVALAVVLREHGGNVLIVAPPWRIELSLTLAVLLLLALFLIAHTVLRVFYWLSSSPDRFRSWRGLRAEKRDHELLESGWIGVLEGRYEQAQKDLSKLLARAKPSQRKVLAALALARAQHHLGDYAQRDESLARARTDANEPRLKEATAVAAAEMLLDQGHAQQALALLQPLQDAASPDANAARLLLQAHQQLGNQEQVYALTRLLLRRGVLEKAQALPLIEVSAAARLAEGGADGYKAIWSDLKSEEKLLPGIALEAALIQSAQGNVADASRILENAIGVSFDPRLLAAYARCPADHVAHRLNKAEGWLKTRPEDPELLATLGSLCLTGQLWGQGERYLQRSLRLRGEARVYALLGNLYDRLGQTDNAARHWRMASGVAGGALPVLATAGVLPAADMRDDPILPDAEAFASANAAPAVDTLRIDPVTGMPVVTDDASAAKRVSHDASTAALDDYFDSAPIPGVDLAQASGLPSDAGRDKN